VALGFSVLGDFMTRLPNELALAAVKNIIECGVRQVGGSVAAAAAAAAAAAWFGCRADVMTFDSALAL
jgi:hypothetical protein